MYKQAYRYKINQFLNRNFGFSNFESKSEKLFSILANNEGLRLRKQVRFTFNLGFWKRIYYFIFPFRFKGYRCDFVYYNYVIEIDSELHKPEKDLRRDQFMKRYGFKIIRIDWKTLYNMDGIEEIKRILRYIKK